MNSEMPVFVWRGDIKLVKRKDLINLPSGRLSYGGFWNAEQKFKVKVCTTLLNGIKAAGLQNRVFRKLEFSYLITKYFERNVQIIIIIFGFNI